MIVDNSTDSERFERDDTTNSQKQIAIWSVPNA
jgi:hypothetical protein